MLAAEHAREQARLRAAEQQYLVILPAALARWLVGERGPFSGYLPVPRSYIRAEIAPGHRGTVLLNETAAGVLRHTGGDGRVELRQGEWAVTFGADWYRLRDRGRVQNRRV